MSFCNYCGDRGPAFQHCKSELEARSKCGIKVNPTAPHEAPTLDVATDRHIKEDETIETLAEIHPAALVRSLATELLEHRKRLCAIENAKGRPEEPNQDGYKFSQFGDVVYAGDYAKYVGALRLHAQHLQDRLNRMEATKILYGGAAGGGKSHYLRMAESALLAKVGGRN